MNKVILMILFVSSSAIAAEGSYQPYTCKTEIDANSCANSCTKATTTWDFKVNPQSGTVLMNVYVNGAPQSTNALKNCQIADADNWVCGETLNYGNNVDSKDVQRLAGGVFVSSLVMHKPNGGIYASFGCAKKKSLFGIFD